MTYLHEGTEYLDDQERRVYEAVRKLAGQSRAANSSQVAAVSGIGRTTCSRVLAHLGARGYIKDISMTAAYRWRLTGRQPHYWRDRNKAADAPAPPQRDV